MKRRKFILSCTAMALTTITANVERSVEAGICLTDRLPMPEGETPIPEKMGGISEIMRTGNLWLEKASHHPIQLNDVGTAIWHHVDGKKTCRDIAAIVSKQYGIDANMILADVEFFVIRLEKERYLKISRIARCYAVKKKVKKQRKIV